MINHLKVNNIQQLAYREVALRKKGRNVCTKGLFKESPRGKIENALSSTFFPLFLGWKEICTQYLPSFCLLKRSILISRKDNLGIQSAFYFIREIHDKDLKTWINSLSSNTQY